MRVCIIGASGKLGPYMIQYAPDRGYKVVGVCRPRWGRDDQLIRISAQLEPAAPWSH